VSDDKITILAISWKLFMHTKVLALHCKFCFDGCGLSHVLTGRSLWHLMHPMHESSLHRVPSTPLKTKLLLFLNRSVKHCAAAAVVLIAAVMVIVECFVHSRQ